MGSSFYETEHELASFGGSLRTYEPSEYVRPLRPEQVEQALSKMQETLDEFKSGLQTDVEEAGDRAEIDIVVTSMPDYYIDGTPVGNRTWLSVEHGALTWHHYNGKTPDYVGNYKLARGRAYSALINAAILNNDFDEMLEVATDSPDPYISKRLSKEMQYKIVSPPAYIGDEWSIQNAEQERNLHNKETVRLKSSLKLYAGKILLENSNEDESTHPLLEGVKLSHFRKSHNRKQVLKKMHTVLTRASQKPIIELKLLSEALGTQAYIHERT